MNWLILGGAVSGLTAVAAGAWLFRFKDSPRIDSPRDAADAAEQALAGFHAFNAVVGTDGAGALAVGTDGRVAVMKPEGEGIAVRQVEWQALLTQPEGIVVETHERRFGDVPLTGVNALDIRRVAGDTLIRP